MSDTHPAGARSSPAGRMLSAANPLASTGPHGAPPSSNSSFILNAKKLIDHPGKEPDINKQNMKQTMLDLEEEAYNASRESYLQYVTAARIDRSDLVVVDEEAQAEFARDLAEAFDQPVHEHSEKLAHLRTIDFGPKMTVEEGAIAKVNGRYFVIAVASNRFQCEGNELIGISTAAPIYSAMEGKAAGDLCTFNGRSLTIEEVL